MGSLLAELGYNEIISADIAANLRKYIALKNPELSAAGRAGIFADAINRIMDGRLPPFDAELVKKLKDLLFRDIAGKAVFSVNCSDVFKAAVKLKTMNPEFLSQLNDWVSDVLKKAVVRESLSGLILHAHGLMGTMHGDDISHMISMAEQSTDRLEYSGDSQAAGEAAETAFAAPLKEEAELPDLSGTCPVQPGPVAGFACCPPMQPALAEKAEGAFSVLLRRCLSVPEPVKVLAASALAVFIIFSAVLTSDTTAAAPDKNNPLAAVIPQVSMASYSVPNKNEYTFSQDSSMEKAGGRRMKATAYDLSVESCGKKPEHPQYGITSSGTKATVGRTIAVDPEVIPLGSRVYISFPSEYSSLDGIYIAEDTGRLIKGDKIDIFFGEDKQGSRKIYKSAMEFGVRYVDVRTMD